MVFHLLILGMGNARLARVLRRYPDDDDLRVIRLIATGLEWFTAFGALFLSSPDATTVSPSAMVLLLPVIAFRYGVRELIIAGVTTGVAVVLLAGVQIWLLHILRLMAAWQMVGQWEAVTATMALIIYALLPARDARWQWQEEQ